MVEKSCQFLMFCYDAAKFKKMAKFVCPLGPFSLAQSPMLYAQHFTKSTKIITCNRTIKPDVLTKG